MVVPLTCRCDRFQLSAMYKITTPDHFFASARQAVAVLPWSSPFLCLQASLLLSEPFPCRLFVGVGVTLIHQALQEPRVKTEAVRGKSFASVGASQM